MKDSGTEYYKAYGDISGSRRGKFADWAKSSNKTCTLDYYLQGKQKGRDNMIKCKVRPALEPWLGHARGEERELIRLFASRHLFAFVPAERHGRRQDEL
jgi:hypothetical protein